MASTSAVSMAKPLTQTTTHKRIPTPNAFFNTLPLRPSKATAALKPIRKIEASASMKETVVKGLTAAALTASMVVPEVAMAADSGVSPSLKNFLLSIGAGGVVLGAILGAVIGVSNFDPVKRT